MSSTQSLDLAIDGMTCTNCAGRVERALRKVDGVQEASVSFASERARVAFGAPATAEVLIARIEQAGYGAHVPASAPEQAHAAQVQDRHALLMLMVSAVLTLPLLLPMLWPALMLPAWLQLLLASPVQWIVGARFYRGAWHALRSGSGNMDVLVALGTTAGYGLSLYLMWAAPAGHSPHLYFEASATIITLVLLGKYLEARAKRQALSAIRSLQALRPEHATLWHAGHEQRVAVSSLRVGDLVVVRPAERFAVDGRVREGQSQVDEALITGESLPVHKAPGDAVSAGAINGEGRLLIETQAVGQESLLERIIRLVESAQASKPPIQQRVDRISQIFVPTIIGLAALTLIGWWLYGVGLEQALVHAVSVLVIACPCALGLATPAALITGTGVAARHGILIRNAQTLERGTRIAAVAFDKTGTLTLGKPTLVGLEGDDTSHALALAGALQAGSEHPLAHAVLQACQARGVATPAARSIKALPGRGIEGEVEGETLALGSGRLLQDHRLQPGALAEQAARWADEGRTVSWLIGTAPARVLGALAFGDQLRPGAKAAVQRLRERGVEVHMLSGDGQGAVHHAAQTLGIEDAQAQQLPQDKAAYLKALSTQHPVAMVGDGINDAPALAAADLSIAMGGGTDVAINSADIALMANDPRRVADALDICQRTCGKIRQNLFWAFIYNLVGIPLAALGMLDPVFAGAAMALSSVSVVSNALLLKTWKPASLEDTP